MDMEIQRTCSSEDGAASAPPRPSLMLRVSGTLDRMVGLIGKVTSWLTLVLVALVAGDVLFRYVWHMSSVAEQELEWHLLAVISLIGASYTLQQRDHVRVDVLYSHYPLQVRRWMNVLVPALVMIPTMAFIGWQSLHFVVMSWEIGEGSPDPGGLPARFVIKAFVPFGFFLAALQSFVLMLDGIARLYSQEPDHHE